MTNDEHISEITSAFLEALKAAAQDLAGEYMKRLRAELQPSGPGRDYAPVLRDGAELLRSTGAQSDTLEALLDAAAKVTPACGLLVLHGTLANGWNCRGITSSSTFKRAILDCSRGIAAHVLTTGAAAEAPVSELDPALVTRLGLYGKSRVGLVPILLRDRPAALLLALLPMGDELPALEVLAQVARMTLELQLYRTAASEMAAEAPAEASAEIAAEAAKPGPSAREPVAPEVATAEEHREDAPEAVHEEVAGVAAEETLPTEASRAEETSGVSSEAAHEEARPEPPAELPPNEVEAFAVAAQAIPVNDESDEEHTEQASELPVAAVASETSLPAVPPDAEVHEAEIPAEVPQQVAFAETEKPADEPAQPTQDEVQAAAAATVADETPATEEASSREVEQPPAAEAGEAEPAPAESPVESAESEHETPQTQPEAETVYPHSQQDAVDEATVKPEVISPAPEEPRHPVPTEAWHTPAPPAPPAAPSSPHPSPAYPAAAHGYPPAYPAAGFVSTPPATPTAPQPPSHSAAYHPTYGSPYAAPAYSVPSAPAQPAMPDPAHDKARRFAKLLVEEIKLYNQSKVAEGRAHADLYQRLREDIEKSRAAYRKRYGQTVSDVDYFTQELLRILADNNPSLMGAGFPG